MIPIISQFPITTIDTAMCYYVFVSIVYRLHRLCVVVGKHIYIYTLLYIYICALLDRYIYIYIHTLLDIYIYK